MTEFKAPEGQEKLVIHLIYERHEITGRDKLISITANGIVAETDVTTLSNDNPQHHYFIVESVVQDLFVTPKMNEHNRGEEFRGDGC